MCKITKEMIGKPIGMFHCSITGEMVIPSEKCIYENDCKDVIN